MKTYSPKPEDIKHDWFVVNADGKILGRLATAIAHRLRGKHKPGFAPHMDMGDFIVVLNAEKIAVTGAKMEKKKYYRHSGFIGGLKELTLREMMAKKPQAVLIKAVKGMLPKNRLSNQLIKKLKVYVGSEHPHAAQKPQTLEL